MQTNIVRQPILDNNNNVIAYEILYEENATITYGQGDTEAANVIEDFLTQCKSNNFLEGKLAYLTFTPNLLLKNIPKLFESNKLVIQIEDNVVVHPLAQRVIYRYKKQGYKIALNNFEFAPRFFQLMDIVDIIKINFANKDKSALSNVITVAKSLNKQIVAYNVNSNEDYKLANSLGVKYMQGAVVAHNIKETISRVDHLQSNFFHLIIAITRDDPDIDEIAEIISRDVTLTFSLLKMVNSAYFALKNRAKSVKQALTILGLGQLKQWIYLLSFKNDHGEMPTELIKISFIRGSLAQELSVYIDNLPISRAEAYLMGMFSTLGTLMDIPLEDALADLPIANEIKDALLHNEGICAKLFNLVLAYERADWKTCNNLASELNIDNNILSQKYFECVESINTIWSELIQANTFESDGFNDKRLGSAIEMEFRK